MQVKYIYSLGSHNWSKLPQEDGLTFYSSILSLLYLIEEENVEPIYVLEVRFTISDPEVKKNISEEKKYSFVSMSEIREFMNTLKPLIGESGSIDIFNFQSNDDMEFFRKWAIERENRLNSDLEILRKV